MRRVALLALLTILWSHDGRSGPGAGVPPLLCVDVADPEGDPLTVTFKGRAAGAPALADAMDVPFQTIGVTSVASGSQACFAWSGLQAGTRYEWTVEVEDGTSMTRGQVWSVRAPCSTDAECDDDNVCTTDACQDNNCVNAPIAGCCLTAADCDDQDGCTGDACDVETHTCSHATCDDGDACTIDACVSAATTNTAALAFNGTSQYVRTADAAPELNAAAFTLEAWIKWDGTTGTGIDTGGGGLTSAIPLVAKGRGQAEATNVDLNYFLGFDTATKRIAADFEEGLGTCTGGTNPGASCFLSCSNATTQLCSLDSQCTSPGTCTIVNGCDGGGTCVGRPGLNHPIFGATPFSTTPTAPWVAGWNHVAVTYDGTCWTVFVNGTDDTELTSPPIPAPRCPGFSPRADNIVPVGIASALNSGGTAAGFFGGQMDEVRIWDHARTQSQIQANRHQQIGTGGGLLGAWALNEGTGSVTADTAGTNNQGTLTGSPTWVTGAANLVDFGPMSCSNVPIGCSDGNPCTLDVCTNGACTNPPGNDGASCDDGNPCTAGEACVTGACSGGGPAPDGTACNDGNPCTASDQCTSGACSGTSSICDDGNACTADACSGMSSLGALAFDGTDDFVTFGNATELSSAQFTLETWFRRTGTGVSNSSGSGGIAALVPLVTKGAPEADGSNVDANYIMGINTAGNVLAADFEDTATGLNHPISGTTAIVNNTWYHAAATYDGQTWRLYLNGNLEATLFVGPFAPRFDSLQHAALGAMVTSAGTRLGAFQGAMDEARIWTVARTQADIQAGMNRQIASATGLAGRWGLNEGSGATALDATTPATNGTLTNFNVAAAWVAGAPSVTAAQCNYTNLADGTVCTDGNACTTQDACGAGTCAGGYSPAPGCCAAAAACNDGNPFTVDACTSGSCSNALPTTCSGSADCNDGSACTTDTCVGANTSALNFDGDNDHVTMGASAGEAALGARAFTLEAWIRRDGSSWGAVASTGTGGVSAVPLVTKGRGEAEGTNVDANYFFGITTAGRPVADFEQFAAAGGWSAGQNHPACSSATITDQSWHHVAVTYSTTTGWKFYIDGVEGTTADGTSCTTCSPVGSCPQSPGVEPRYDSIQHFGLGTAMTSTGATAGFFAGIMDEARVWNRALTAAEVQSGRDQQLTSGTGLIGRWGLNENTGTSAADSTSPAQNGTLTNSPAWTSTDKAPLFGACQRPAGNAGGVCRPSGGVCDIAETCNGTNTSCPANGFVPSTTSCRSSAGECDPAETCTGASAGCPSDARSVSGTACSSDGLVCTADTCNGSSAACQHAPGNAGTQCRGAVDECDAAEACDGSTSACPADEPAPDGSECNDGSACTTDDACAAGICLGGPAADCDDENPCTDDSCNPLTGCVYANNTASCDDGSACTTDDACVDGVCASGPARDCDDENSCTDDSCDSLTGCVYANNTAGCDDGSACTTGDACADGECAGGPALDCNDVNPCTDDSCDSLAGCVHANNTATCDDGSACTTADTCAAGACVGGPAPDCNDNNPCTDDGCSPTTGCAYTDNTESCDDGSACTTGDTCAEGACAGGAALDCNDNNPCTDDSCDSLTGCVRANNTVSCDDGSACTAGDTCAGGVCQAGAPVPPPPAVEGVLVSGHETPTIQWTSVPGDVAYDIVSQTLSDLVANGVSNAACLFGGAATTSYDDVRVGPDEGDGYYYLIRARSACGAGSYGFGSSGVERVPATPCP